MIGKWSMIRTGSGNLNLTGEVALLGRSLDVGGGLDHGHVEVLALAAAAVHLGEPHGGGVLDGAARLAPAHSSCAPTPCPSAPASRLPPSVVRSRLRDKSSPMPRVLARVWPDSPF